MATRSYDYTMAALSGVLLAFSFPKFGHPALGWVALTPLLTTMGRGSLRRAFNLGLTSGLLYFAGTLYWITGVMTTYGGLHPWVAVPVNVALVAYMALFPAIFALLVRRLVVTFGSAGLFAAPCVWVATELGRTHIFTGFPWVLLGYSQVAVTPIAQLGSLLGVFGLSALVAAVSAALALTTVRQRASSWQRFGPLAVTLLIVAAVGVWGSLRVRAGDLTAAGTPLRVGLLQGNVDQAEKWDKTRASRIFASYLEMTRQAIREGANLVIWPESSTPFSYQEGSDATEQIQRIAREARVPVLVGSNEVEAGVPVRSYNAAFLIRQDGSTGGNYRKMHLVPFGEYVPLPRLLFFAGPLVEAISSFSAGETPSLLPLDGGHRISTAICYEIVYPNLVRQFVAGGSELLTTITNDAWFGRTSAPYQHFAQASMRAIENGRYLVRAANTGISGIVDPYGRVVAETRIYEPAVLVGEARLLNISTLYARIGDLFAYACAVATLLLLLQSLLWRHSTISRGVTKI